MRTPHLSHTVEEVIRACLRQADRPDPEVIGPDTALLDLMDSLQFAIVVVRLEDQLGYDPFSTAETVYYPRTFGEFVSYYEANAPRP